LFNLYSLYFGNGLGDPGEFSITTGADLENLNPAGFEFMQEYFDLKNEPL